MELTPREKDKLLLFTAGLLAERRKEKGLKLNYPEAMAYISCAILEGAREGQSVAQLMDFGRTLLTSDDVMEGIPEMIHEVQIEATFADGTKLVTVHDPILPSPSDRNEPFTPGEILTQPGDLELNEGREKITLAVANTGDRPVQVGSHFHFAETNPALSFDRDRSRGFRLDIAAGTAVRFEPGQTREVTLVAYAGERRVYGFNAAVMGPLED